MTGGSYFDGGVGEADEQRRLGEREVFGALGEVGLGRRLDAVGAVAVVDGVEIHHEDVVLGVDLLHLDGDVGLADLALDRGVELLLGEDRVAHELLRDGRSTLVAAAERGDCGARDTPEVDAAVLVEALVLDVDGALQDVGRDVVLGDGLAVLCVEAGELVAVAVDDLGRLRHEVGVCVGVVGKVRQPAGDVADHADAEGDARYEQETQQRQQDGGDDVPLGASAAVALAWTHG